MTAAPGSAGSFEDLCLRAHEEARRRRRPVMVSWHEDPARCAIDVPALLAAVADDRRRAFVWSSRWSGLTILGVGTALDLHGHGVDRFTQVGRSWRRHLTTSMSNAPSPHSPEHPARPLLVGGFAFQADAGHPLGAFPDGLMWVPEAQLTWTSPQSPLLTLNAQVAESDDPVAVAERARTSARVLAGRPQPAAGPDPLAELVQELPSAREWRALVLDARKAIEAGPLTKVVLSRQLLLRTHGPQVAGHALRHLLASQDTGAVFGVRLAQRWFLGATPECLVRLRAGEVRTHGLAGSAPRHADPVDDERYADWLRTDPKIHREHAVVTAHVERKLRDVCTDVQTGGGNPVLKLPHVQHRQTDIRAVVRQPPQGGLLELARLLHPTPAVGGHPGHLALDWLARHEPFDRGWYAGPVGWMDSRSEGELAVAIRSAAVSGHRAAVYAGCGIVSGSDPDEEYAESSLKMRTMLAALGVPIRTGHTGTTA
ncbi:isochorismate synthase MenF [Micromonospora sp. HUAS LYJ1]|uniref:isochorismate synthase n=1 Tax=Micromonospora sp. HUAS LYJ1 TaxID=3061626 RepID=UPI002671F18A|nr:isochorismate synthase [Micromonospora sp. HUAS LYJ1]WKU07148.1 isochorismate synthase [Micromonospora sp. HUAS LYJ1]